MLGDAVSSIYILAKVLGANSHLLERMFISFSFDDSKEKNKTLVSFHSTIFLIRLRLNVVLPMPGREVSAINLPSQSLSFNTFLIS